MNTAIVTKEDMDYLKQQPTGNLNMILSGMTALLNENTNMAEVLEKQNWFQRMCKTILGKNKITQQEIQQNHEKINAYMTEAMTVLYEQQCIDQQLMLSLGNQITEIYTEHLQLKQIVGAFAGKLNQKIESVDNFHMLNTEIEQGVYDNMAPIVAVCKILSQMDKRCIQDYRKMNILNRTMGSKNILADDSHGFSEYLKDMLNMDEETIGVVYMELNTIRENFVANIFAEVIEQYYFLPDLTRKMKNKELMVESFMQKEQIDTSIKISINEIYNELVESKLDMLDGLIPISAIQYDSKLAEAEKLFVEYKLDQAFEIFKTLAEKDNGRAMYFVGLYYYYGLGKIKEDKEEAKAWYLRGNETGDALSAIEGAICLRDLDYESEVEQLFEDNKESVLELAQGSDMFAQYEIAQMYWNGDGVEKDKDAAAKWYRKSAEQGNWIAQYEISGVEKEEEFEWLCNAAEKGYDRAQIYLAKQYRDGDDLAEQDDEQAAFWYNKAVEQGNEEAITELMQLYKEERGGASDSEVVALYRKAVEMNNSEAMYLLGISYALGKGVEQDDELTIEWYTKAARAGNADAMYILGYSYEYACGVDADGNKAIYWYEKAATAGNAAAMYAVGNICNAQGDVDSAVYWYKRSAEGDCVDAMYQIGYLYEIGLYVDLDEYEAVKWYRKAAEAGHADSMYRLGFCYYTGSGVTENESKAAEWMKKAVDAGSEDAIVQLGAFYSYGIGVVQDEYKAVELYRRAADNGNTSGMISLGTMYAAGSGVAQSYTKAFEWYERAAELGDVSAMESVAQCYEKGEGVRASFFKAMEWRKRIQQL